MKLSQYDPLPSVWGLPNVHGTFVPKNLTASQFTSLQNKITSHISRQFTPHHYTSHHFTYLHSIIPTSLHLLVTIFSTLFLNVFSLQGKDDSRPAGNWWWWKKQAVPNGQLPHTAPHAIIPHHTLSYRATRYHTTPHTSIPHHMLS